MTRGERTEADARDGFGLAIVVTLLALGYAVHNGCGDVDGRLVPEVEEVRTVHAVGDQRGARRVGAVHDDALVFAMAADVADHSEAQSTQRFGRAEVCSAEHLPATPLAARTHCVWAEARFECRDVHQP